MKKRTTALLTLGLALATVLFTVLLYYGVRGGYPRPYADIVAESGEEPFLVYSVMKAESGFREDAESSAGAVGIMQLKPSTAEFICRLDDIAFDAERLGEGAYNVMLGCRYLRYLRERFPCRETALAAYNAGEGTVARWLADPGCSPDGVTLARIPYAETKSYLKKIAKFMKIYEFYYG